jgi:cytochrome c5
LRNAVLGAVVASAITAAIACKDDKSSTEPTVAPEDGRTGPAGSGLITGLPCDVQALLENRCIACHDGTRAGVPPMLDYDDLVAPSKLYPGKTVAVAALSRMKSTTTPMPPPPAVPPEVEEIETFETWVILGAPRAGKCTDPPPEFDPDEQRVDAAPLPALEGCTSGQAWTGGDNGSPIMHPGRACNACHQELGGPNLKIAGTIYPSAHEPDDCNGSKPPPTLTVTVTDSKERVLELTANAVGNYYIERTGKLTPPFRARISNGTKTREMMGSVTSGDCNSCHTVSGLNGAPGRIMAP